MNDFKLALSTKPIFVILSLSAAIRVIVHFLLLPSSPSIFGPDEGTYASLAKHVSLGVSVEEFISHPTSLYNSSRSFILPSALLVKLGVDELNAVRIISSLYGLASCLVLALCFIAFMRLRNTESLGISNRLDKKFLVLLCLYAFIPSNFVWSTIGLRESASQFWLMSTFYFLLKLASSKGQKSYAFSTLTIIALTLGYGSRPESALVFNLVALTFSVIILFTCQKLLPLIALMISLIMGQAFTTTPKVEASASLGAFEVTKKEFIQSATPKPVESIQSATPKTVEYLETEVNQRASVLCKEQNQIIRFDGNEYRCIDHKTYREIERNPVNTLKERISQVQTLELRSKLNALDAKSALPNSTCPDSPKDVSTLVKCNIIDLPFRLFSFLFRPFIFFDRGSLSLNLAALENVGWIVLIPLSLWTTLRRKLFNFERITSLGLVSFVLVYSCSAALYEGNLGTAFRHKSTIFWPLVFILMIVPRLIPRTGLVSEETKSLRHP